ncbi:nitroreductase family protein [Allosediminivita pacifica]|uniref:Nitroreductase n=1 Tax=Allosediminivita pacifica TaxID=1267769 RepID=A0A2T6ANK7_9RHOB|nr:nitroreductase family protein [Allosediminivita pacifica]PTX45387.1 nitroreductase [Allosediminivita pacifica]GGB20883.1 hypothetical protein GCM10011324_33670 [Allosediminivita pacifica]
MILDLEARGVLDRLATRTSCREFDGTPLSRDTIRAVMRDAIEAPSSCNHQSWHFIVVTDRDKLARAQRISGGNLHFGTCGALIYLCFLNGWSHRHFSIVQSVAAAGYHMILSAHLRGISSIYNAGIGPSDEVRELLDLPAGYTVQGAIALGYTAPGTRLTKPPRRPLDDVLSFERFERPEAADWPQAPSDAYPYGDAESQLTPYAEWDPTRWTWDQIGDLRGYAVWAKSPIAGVYVSARQGTVMEGVLDLMPDLPAGAEVIDVMGWGGTEAARLLTRLPKGARLTLADLHDGNLTFMRQRLAAEPACTGRTLQSLRMRGPDLPRPDASADLVTLPLALEHAPDPAALLASIARVLRPGGHLLLAYRNAASPYGPYWEREEKPHQVSNQGPFRPLDPDAVTAMAGQHFDIVAEAGFGREATHDTEKLEGRELRRGRIHALLLQKP